KQAKREQRRERAKKPINQTWPARKRKTILSRCVLVVVFVVPVDSLPFKHQLQFPIPNLSLLGLFNLSLSLFSLSPSLQLSLKSLFSMVKNKMKKKNREETRQQICVPKSCQQPRSHGSKRRTDFSHFFSSSSSPLLPRLQGCSKFERLANKDTLSSITTSTIDEHCQAPPSIIEELPKFSVVQCNTSQNGVGISTNSMGVTSTQIDSSHEELPDACTNRINVQNKSGDGAILLSSPNKSTSQLTECSDLQATPGTIMWARTSHQIWWPAKIVEGRSSPVSINDQGACGHVLVQYYGNDELAWVDPVGDLSEFDECFEERSCNPMEAFQDALKQALHLKDHLVSSIQLDRSPDRLMDRSQHESVAQSNKWIESSSSREEDDYRERRRGKRQRKPKLHFDEVAFHNKSMKRMRRLRIMRFLGLVAPVGSPFSLASSISNC
ncbi:hypothetical protein AQUCO_00901097v1, partial [Aquilegia coerulea]